MPNIIVNTIENKISNVVELPKNLSAFSLSHWPRQIEANGAPPAAAKELKADIIITIVFKYIVNKLRLRNVLKKYKLTKNRTI